MYSNYSAISYSKMSHLSAMILDQLDQIAEKKKKGVTGNLI